MKGLTIFPVHAARADTIIEIRRLDESSGLFGGWFLSEEDPIQIVRGFSRLRVEDGFNLIGFKYGDSMGGNGVVWALPAAKAVGEMEEAFLDGDLFSVPKPAQALNPMEVIDGDGSPHSYLQASILFHELQEYGAAWHGINWGYTSILSTKEAIKLLRDQGAGDSPARWEYITERPEIWQPHFFYSDNGFPTIVFYTHHSVYKETVSRLTHTFSPSSYTMSCEATVIAQGRTGIIP